MMFLLYTLHVLVCFFLIAVVLLQQGKGADLSVFGGGATQTAFGARGAASVLHKLTVGSFVGFIITTLAIGVAQSNRSASVIQDLPPEQAIEEVATPEPVGALPVDEPAADVDAEAMSSDDALDGDAAESDALDGDVIDGDAVEGDTLEADDDPSDS